MHSQRKSSDSPSLMDKRVSLNCNIMHTTQGTSRPCNVACWAGEYSGWNRLLQSTWHTTDRCSQPDTQQTAAVNLTHNSSGRLSTVPLLRSVVKVQNKCCDYRRWRNIWRPHLYSNCTTWGKRRKKPSGSSAFVLFGVNIAHSTEKLNFDSLYS